MRTRLPLLALLLCLFALLLSFPTQAADAAREALALCLNLIIPSLFPFFVFSTLFVSLGLAEDLGRLLRPLMGRLFRLRGAAAAPLILGLLGGYPVGIRAAAELYESGQCSREECIRLAFFCNNCGPAFLLSVAGIGIFAAKEAGYLLLLTHWAAALLLAFLSRFLCAQRQSPAHVPETSVRRSHFTAAFPESVREAFLSTLHVSAFIILFSVLIALLRVFGLLPLLAHALAQLLPEGSSVVLSESLLIGFFELSTGAYHLALDHRAPLALPLCALILGFGGLSVHCQSLPYLNRCPGALRPYLLGKLLHGLLAAALTAFFAPLFYDPAAASFAPMGLAALPAARLLQHEILALFALSGIFSLFPRKKAGKEPPSAL